MMNQSKGNQSGCLKPRRNVDEGIGSVLERLEAYICDVVCFCNNQQLTQEERDRYCDHCRIGKKIDEIEAEYEKINNFSKSSAYALLEKYRKIIPCKDCRYRISSRDGEKEYCTLSTQPERIHEGYGCSWGIEKE